MSACTTSLPLRSVTLTGTTSGRYVGGCGRRTTGVLVHPSRINHRLAERGLRRAVLSVDIRQLQTEPHTRRWLWLVGRHARWLYIRSIDTPGPGRWLPGVHAWRDSGLLSHAN